jgi:hypothetical protein
MHQVVRKSSKSRPRVVSGQVSNIKCFMLRRSLFQNLRARDSTPSASATISTDCENRGMQDLSSLSVACSEFPGFVLAPKFVSGTNVLSSGRSYAYAHRARAKELHQARPNTLFQYPLDLETVKLLPLLRTPWE